MSAIGSNPSNGSSVVFANSDCHNEKITNVTDSTGLGGIAAMGVSREHESNLHQATNGFKVSSMCEGLKAPKSFRIVSVRSSSSPRVLKGIFERKAVPSGGFSFSFRHGQNLTPLIIENWRVLAPRAAAYAKSGYEVTIRGHFSSPHGRDYFNVSDIQDESPS